MLCAFSSRGEEDHEVRRSTYSWKLMLLFPEETHSHFPLASRIIAKTSSERTWNVEKKQQRKNRAAKNFHTNVITKLFTRHAIRKKCLFNSTHNILFRFTREGEAAECGERNRFLMSLSGTLLTVARFSLSLSLDSSLPLRLLSLEYFSVPNFACNHTENSVFINIREFSFLNVFLSRCSLLASHMALTDARFISWDCMPNFYLSLTV